MKSNEFHEIILKELADLKKDVKEIREKDIPKLNVQIAVVKERTSRKSIIITSVGGALTLAVSTAAAYLLK